MKKVIRLTEDDLTRLVSKVLIEQELQKGRKNPRWINFFNKLKVVGNPKVLTFTDFDKIENQSLNWGTAKNKNARYGLGIISTKENISFVGDDKNLIQEILNWWSKMGYKTDRYNYVYINFDNADKVASDLQRFFKSFPTEIQRNVYS